MYHQDKRKGLPRGFRMLAAGIVIGAVGAFLAFSNSMGIPVEPTPTLPTIPTPLPATSLPMDESVFVPQVLAEDPSVLKSFTVNEMSGQIALSYWNGYDSILEIRRWDGQSIGSVPVIKLGKGDYNRLSFNSRPLALAASSGRQVAIYDLTTNLPAGPVVDGMEGVYSPDGQWFALSQSDHTIDMYHTNRSTALKTLNTEGFVSDMTFSPDGYLLAAVTMNPSNSNQMQVELFSLMPELKRLRVYRLDGAPSSHVVFSRDSKLIATASTDSVHVIQIDTGEQRYFDTPNTTIRRVSFDATGEWLAAGGGDSAAGEESGVYFYRLSESSPLPPDPSSAQFIVTPLRDVRDLQFVTEGLLVSDSTSTITLYRWAGDSWVVGSAVLTEKDLE